MNFDITMKKLYNTMLDILKEKKILKFFSVLPIQKYFKLPMIKLPMPRLPKVFQCQNLKILKLFYKMIYKK